MRPRFSRALAAAAVLALAAPVLADTVYLRNGQAITGKVEDRGAYILVKKPLGDVRIERHEIRSIEIDGGGAAETQRDLDVVVLLSGDEISGRVRLEDEGRRVIVTRVLNGHENALELDHRQVRSILWAQAGAGPAAREGIAETIERLLSQFRAGDEAARKSAREQLVDLGVLVLPYLENRPEEKDGAVAGLLREVVAISRVRTYLTPALVEKVPNLARRLVAKESRARLEALREALLASPKDCPALLDYFAKTDGASEVRAFVLAELALQNRTSELLDLLQSNDGSLRLAAAIALGDNGVYVGIPVVIEGLKLGDAAIRKVAISRLEAWTGQFLGFFADDPPEKRAAAVASWERWWAGEGKKFAADSVRATIRKDEVTEDEKQLGLADWVRAQKAWDAIAEASPPLTGEARRAELEKVRFLLRKALESYPQCVNARLSLGILEYIELGELDAGAREIETVLTRYADEGGRPAKVLAYFHLGRIAEMQKRWLDADRCYRQARSLDPRNAEVLRALGALDYDRALRDDSLSAEERKRAFAEAIDLFTTAIQAVDEREIEVGDSVRSAGAATEEMPFRRDAFVRSLENAKQELTRLAAELRYLRGRARAALQRDEEAYQDFVAARELAPENPLYRGAADKWRPAPARQDPEKPRFRPEDVK